MKKLLLSIFAITGALLAFSQEQTPAPETADKKQVSDSYRRNSLCLMLIDEADMPKRDVIKQAFNQTPTPDKYNDHGICERIISYTTKVSDADVEAFRKSLQSNASASAPKKGGGFSGFTKGLASAAMGGSTGKDQSVMFDANSKEYYAAVANRHIMENKIAKQLFDKWFLDTAGNFSMELVKERGMYDASLLDVQTAKDSQRGTGMLMDAGEELVNHTFVVVSRFRYLSKEELVNEMNATTQTVASGMGGSAGGYLSLAASLGSMGASVAMGAGHYVQTTSFLFQLDWSEDISNKFYTMWGDSLQYEAADIFSLKYVGMETAFANVKAGIFTNKPEEELIQIATVNAVDAVLAKLEKKYDVFKTKSPLLSVDPLTAAIGMKEGVAPGDKYEVLEKSIDPETNKTLYKRVGVISACKNGVCDNRYMAVEELALKGAEQGTTVTRFEGTVKGIYPGMLIRQIK